MGRICGRRMSGDEPAPTAQPPPARDAARALGQYEDALTDHGREALAGHYEASLRAFTSWSTTCMRHAK
jgi:hypothetical protein